IWRESRIEFEILAIGHALRLTVWQFFFVDMTRRIEHEQLAVRRGHGVANSLGRELVRRYACLAEIVANSFGDMVCGSRFEWYVGYFLAGYVDLVDLATRPEHNALVVGRPG